VSEMVRAAAAAASGRPQPVAFVFEFVCRYSLWLL
jgi:hypothetical protein